MSKRAYAHVRKDNKKPLFLALTVVVLAALLAGSVFAWHDFSQSITNRFKGSHEPDVTLHNEFDGENKDVFVENTGTAALYVRIRLDEFMQIGTHIYKMATLPVPDVYDKQTWIPHTFTGPELNDCDNTDITDERFHSYYTWDMSGRGSRPYYPGVPGMVYTTLGSDGKVDDITGSKITSPTAAPVLLSVALDISSKVASSTALSGEEQTSWAAIQAGCWLLDDTDSAENGGGWAYWSRPLAAGAATNLVLDSVSKTDKEISEDWIYRIDVKMQAVTASDFEKWDNTEAGAPFGFQTSTGAKLLIGYWKTL